MKGIAILINMVTGYLYGAGLGALSVEFVSNRSDSAEKTVLLLALLVIGPLGALLGMLIASSEEEAKTAQRT